MAEVVEPLPSVGAGLAPVVEGGSAEVTPRVSGLQPGSLVSPVTLEGWGAARDEAKEGPTTSRRVDVPTWRAAKAEELVFVFEHLLPALGTFLVLHCDATSLPDVCVLALHRVYDGVSEWAKHPTTKTCVA